MRVRMSSTLLGDSAQPETAAPMRRTDVAPDVARMDFRRLLTRSFASRQPFVSISGTSWEAVPSPTTEHLTDVAWCQQLAVAVGHQGLILVSNDDGKIWKTLPTGSRVVFHRVAVAGDRVFVVGEKGTVLQTQLGKQK